MTEPLRLLVVHLKEKEDDFLSMFIFLCMYVFFMFMLYIYICVCVWVCVTGWLGMYICDWVMDKLKNEKGYEEIKHIQNQRLSEVVLA